jgi:hypothetical protein
MSMFEVFSEVEQVVDLPVTQTPTVLEQVLY